MKIFTAVMLMAFIPMSASKDLPTPDSWFCKSVGNLENTQIIFLTEVWTDDYPNNYTLRQEMFSEHINKITENKFVPSFTSKCRDYLSFKRAEKHRDLEIETAKQYNFSVVIFPWSYTPDERTE